MDASQEQVIFEIISFAGEARSYSFQALSEARTGDFTQAQKTMELAEASLRSVHDVQTALITKEIEGSGTGASLLMAHAQDHLMTAMLAHDLIKEMIEQYQLIHSLKK